MSVFECVCVLKEPNTKSYSTPVFQSDSEHLGLRLAQEEQPSLPSHGSSNKIRLKLLGMGTDSLCFDMTVKPVRDEAALTGISSCSSAISS